MATGAIRGSRIGAGPMGESERGDNAPRKAVTYYCARNHKTLLHFAVEAESPQEWDCVRCGLPAGIDLDDRPTQEIIAPFKTHLAYAKERRSDKEAQAILKEALVDLRTKRKTGEIVF